MMIIDIDATPLRHAAMLPQRFRRYADAASARLFDEHYYLIAVYVKMIIYAMPFSMHYFH